MARGSEGDPKLPQIGSDNEDGRVEDANAIEKWLMKEWDKVEEDDDEEDDDDNKPNAKKKK